MIDLVTMHDKALSFGVELNDIQLMKLDQYAEMLVDWNTRINLTSITDSEGIMIRHFEDSLAMLRYIYIPQGAKMIDVGSGAGFPGLVLKIARPDLQITLLDSLNKRISFLEAVAEKIELPVEALHLRAEDGGKMKIYRERFDFACARAVSDLRELVEYCLPFVKVGGKFISLKGPSVIDELNAARPGIGQLGGKVNCISSYSISDGSGRNIIEISKVKPTPEYFPRTSSKIKKHPL